VLFVIMPPIWAASIAVFRLSWRVRHVDVQRSRDAKTMQRAGNCVFAVWHQRLFAFLRHIRGTKGTVMVSLSPDGELIARTLRLLGHGAVRGSSSRGASGALRNMTLAVKSGRAGMMMADGPKGPLWRAKIGPVAVARDSGVGWVIPSSSAARPVIKLKSWDRFQIPLPFAKVVFAYGEPIAVPLDATREQLEICRQKLEAALNVVRDAADAMLAGRLPLAAS
jgi:lysophospholipid acyltransferase (LPLAT)-like uncharacterized protein